MDLGAQKIHCIGKDKTGRRERSISHCVMNSVQDFSLELNVRSEEEKFSFLGKRNDRMMGTEVDSKNF